MSIASSARSFSLPKLAIGRISIGRQVLLGVLLVALQYVLSRQIEVLGVRPEILLFVTVVVGLNSGVRRGAIIGFWAGVGADLFTTMAFGTSAFAYVIAGTLAGVLGRDSTRMPIVEVLITAASSFAGVIVFALIADAGGAAAGTVGRVLWVAVVVGVINGLLAPFAIRLFAPLWRGKGNGNNW